MMQPSRIGRAMPAYSKTIHTVVTVILSTLNIANAIALPLPTGPFGVGVRKYAIEHYNDHDPWAPNKTSTAFLATIFYPTRLKSQGTPKPYLNPETATFYEQGWGFTPGLLASLTSTVQQDAPFLNPKELGKGEHLKGLSSLPTILFGPAGAGPPVEGNTILISELASHGYAVVGIDHPFEQPFIKFPNGTGVWGADIDDDSDEFLEAAYETRLEDNAVFLNHYLSKLANKSKLLLSTTHLGTIGYSLGGAGSFGSLHESDILISGLDLDGTLLGPLASNSSAADEKKPVFLLGNEGHLAASEGDYTWTSFPLWQTGYQRMMLINGTTHLDFCDNTFWKTLDGSGPVAGSIDGHEQVRILNAYVKAFFDLTLLGRNSPILDGPSPEFPEVVFIDEP
ncbi:hypothetical protein GGR54DRAFT_605106 [Hypoxylon sp. NC1633]|nr:hypothetical protein GGR54DRAFT_605106 [Hypoxylon sp. NC1633]